VLSVTEQQLGLGNDYGQEASSMKKVLSVELLCCATMRLDDLQKLYRLANFQGSTNHLSGISIPI
jgi:hypothetical protein